jgi:soluble lytic murein transglycosylase-like protein
MRLRSLLVAVALLCSAASTRAELWAWIDGRGVAHVALQPLDGRYRLVLGPHHARTGRVTGKADAAAGLLTWLEIAPQVRVMRPWLRDAARMHGVDVELLTALIAVESGFDASAVSPRGAMGLMQLTLESAGRYAGATTAQRPLDELLLEPRANIHIGARMLADLLRRFGRVDMALAAWNAGEGTVRRHGGAMPPIAETRSHVQLVLELYWAMLQRSQRITRIQLAVAPMAP